MDKWLRIGAVALVVLLISVAFAASDVRSANAARPATETEVVNTAANPVPVAVQGTLPVSGTVNVGNAPFVHAEQSGTWHVGIDGTPSVNVMSLPTVDAHQDGTWNVGVTSMPSVSVSSLPAVNINSMPSVAIAGTVQAVQSGTWTVQVAGGSSLSSVNVTNDAAHAVPTTRVDEPARHAVHAYHFNFFNSSLGQYRSTVFTVPPGKRLAIEHVNIATSLVNPGAFSSLEVEQHVGLIYPGGFPGGPGNQSWVLPVQHNGGFGGRQNYVTELHTRVYVEAGWSIEGIVDQNGAGSGDNEFAFVVDGYLVDL